MDPRLEKAIHQLIRYTVGAELKELNIDIIYGGPQKRWLPGATPVNIEDLIELREAFEEAETSQTVMKVEPPTKSVGWLNTVGPIPTAPRTDDKGRKP